MMVLGFWGNPEPALITDYVQLGFAAEAVVAATVDNESVEQIELFVDEWGVQRLDKKMTVGIVLEQQCDDW